jgi:hypothetical protein
LKTVRSIFLVLFVLSTLGALILFASSQAAYLSAPVTQAPAAGPTQPVGNPTIVEPPSQNSMDVNFIALAGSAVTSITTLIGFITTTIITWRKEKREAALADVERKKLEIELKKNKLELEELKHGRVKKKIGR